MISVNDLTVAFGGTTLLNKLTFMINPDDRIGLVGRNGAGKSTLIKILAGLRPPSSGHISIPDSCTIGYLPQQMVVTDGLSVFDEAMTAFVRLQSLEQEIENYTKQLEERTDYESEEYLKIIEKLTDANDHYHLLGGDSKEGSIEITLMGLGFKRSDFTRPTSEFSGGWRMRIELAKILLTKPSILFLDEPTNHLDIESIQWLEDYLKGNNGALVLISHDRAFLDAVTTRTLEISLGKIYDYRVPYSQYVVLRKERREQQLAAYTNQQKMIEKTEDFIERFRYKATKSNQVQSRIKQLDRLDIIEIDEEDTSALHIKFPPAPRSGQIIFEAKDLGKRYGDHTVFNKVDLIIERGEKVALVGRNGEGKTTMARVIVGDLAYEEGEAINGFNVNLGYFSQNQDGLWDENISVFDTLDQVAKGDIRTQLRNILGAFLFRGEDVDKRVKVLSGGERSRLAMARLMLEPYNVLVLDEPTNHMDMSSKDILKNALMAYDGTLIVVSHDREFLDGLVNKVYEFRDGKVKEHLGGIYDFLRRRKVEDMREIERKDAPVKTAIEKKEAVQPQKSYKDKKEYDRQLRKLTAQVEAEEKKIEELEKQLADADAKMANPDEVKIDDVFLQNYNALQKSLEEAMAYWEKAQLELEEFKSE